MSTRTTRHSAILALLWLPCLSLAAQTAVGPWHLKPIGGELRLEGRYQYQEAWYGEINEARQGPYLIGGLSLDSYSYLWRPDIFTINFTGEFNPETRKENYLSLPDRSEVRTLEKIELRTGLFSGRSISLNSYLSLNNSYYNRENLTNIRNLNKEWGTVLTSANTWLPTTVSYRNLQWNQTETESGRTFSMKQNSLNGRILKSFSELDKTSLAVYYDTYDYSYYDLDQINNRVLHLALNSSLFLDEDHRYSLNTSAHQYEHRGNQLFSKSDISESLLFHLPANLDLNARYSYYRMETPSVLTRINRGRASLQHQLYESLKSELFADLSGTRHTIYNESAFKTGAGFRYTKKTRFGRLNLDYRYFRHFNRVESETGYLSIVNEEHSFDESGELFLDKPYVQDGSIVITDETGTIIYQEGPDFLLDELNSYTRVTRVPGGLILPGQILLVSYIAIQPGNSSYIANNNSFGASVLILDQLADLYFRYGQQDFTQVEAPEYLNLNTYKQYTAGLKLQYKFLNGGLEYDRYNSSIIPYERMSYFINANIKAGARLLLSFNGTYRNYTLLAEDLDHKYTNLSGRLAWKISTHTKLNLQAGYLLQKGQNIDLDLFTAKAEVATSIRKLTLLAGINYYDKNYVNSTYTSLRSYLQLIRKF